MNIAVFGAGYVGLVVAACFTKLGHSLRVIDVDRKKITGLNNGQIPIYEPGLESLFQEGMDSGQLSFTDDAASALVDVDYVFIAVGTPSLPNGQADTTFVLEVAKIIGQNIQSDAIVVQKSTVPVGTGDEIESVIIKQLKRRQVKLNVPVVSNPEFLREGMALKDFLAPDRVLIGSNNQDAISSMQKLYTPVTQTAPFIVSSRRSAEIAKYACNAMLATKISFVNELSRLCEAQNADILQVKSVMATDHRIGPHFISPGPGYGGSCFPKDVKALTASFESSGLLPTLISAAESVNEMQKHHVFSRIKSVYGALLSSKTIAVWGLAFKPDTDDIREAPAIALIERLVGEDTRVQAYDPKATEAMGEYLGPLEQVRFFASKEDALCHADMLVILTDWDEFKALPESVFNTLADKWVFDTRNIYAESKFTSIKVIGTGRGSVHKIKESVLSD